MSKRADMELKDYWLVIKRRKWWILGSLLASLAVALALNTFTKPVYRATTRIQINPEPNRSLLSGEVLENTSAQSENLALFTAAELITNRELLGRVVQTLRERGEFSDADLNQGFMAFLTSKLGPISQWLNGRSTLEHLSHQRQASAADPSTSQANLAINWLMQQVSVEPVHDTRLVSISAEHSDPRIAQDIANILAEYFVEYQAQHSAASSTSVVSYLEAQISQVKRKIEQSEQMQHGASEAGMFSLQEKLRQLTESLGTLRHDLLVSDTELAKAREVYKGRHPKLVVLESENAAIRQNISRSEAEMRSINSRLQQYSIIEADLRSNRDLYSTLLTKLQEAQMTGKAQAPMVQIVEKAALQDQPVRPLKILNLVVCLAVGFMIGTGLAFLREYMRQTIRTPQDVDEHLQLPVLGLIPRVS